MGITSSIATVLTAVPAAAGKPILDQLTSLFTDFGTFLKVGAPIIIGLVVLVYCLMQGMKLTKILMLAAAASFVTYLSIGGGINDISNGFENQGKKTFGSMGVLTPGAPEETGLG